MRTSPYTIAEAGIIAQIAAAYEVGLNNAQNEQPQPAEAVEWAKELYDEAFEQCSLENLRIEAPK